MVKNNLNLLFFIVLASSSIEAFPQDLSLELFNQDRVRLTSNGIIVLGVWSLGNILFNPILQLKSVGSKKYFYQMNTFWNIINLGIAILGYYQAVKGDNYSLTLSNSLLEQNKIEKLLLFNAGLDLGYVVTGFYLQERSKTRTKHIDRLKGFGQSLVLQGVWLFVFDVGFYYIQNNHSKQLYELMEVIQKPII